MLCRKCGKKLLPDSKFCDKCGIEVAATAGEDPTSSAGEMPDPDDRQKWDEWYTGVVEKVGAREVLPPECRRCGHPCGENGTTCPNCGHEITAATVATPEQHRLIDEFLDRNIENLRVVAPPPAPAPKPTPKLDASTAGDAVNTRIPKWIMPFIWYGCLAGLPIPLIGWALMILSIWTAIKLGWPRGIYGMGIAFLVWYAVRLLVMGVLGIVMPGFP